MKTKMGIKNKKKTGAFAKSLLTAVLVLIFVFSPIIKAPQASAWDAVLGAISHRFLDTIYEMLTGIMANVAKQAAIKALYAQISVKIGGSSSGGAMFVVNWRDYLVDQPQKAAGVYLNDYLSQVTRGRGSLSGYVSAKNFQTNLKLFGKNYEGVGPGSFSLGLTNNDPSYARLIENAEASGINLNMRANAENYIAQLVEGAKKATIENTGPQVTYFKDPSFLLENRTFYDTSVFTDENSLNHASAFEDNAKKIYAKEIKTQEDINSKKAEAGGGFIGKETAEGLTEVPGSVAKAMVEKTVGAPIDSLTSAQGLQGIAQSFVTSMIGKFFDQGIGKVSASISKKIGNGNASVQLNANVKTNGPSALYNNSNK